MTIVPFQSGPTEYSILIVLDQQNIDRILHRDPACVMIEKLPRVWRKRKLKDVIVCYGTKEQMELFAEMTKAGDILGAFKVLGASPAKADPTPPAEDATDSSRN